MTAKQEVAADLTAEEWDVIRMALELSADADGVNAEGESARHYARASDALYDKLQTAGLI